MQILQKHYDREEVSADDIEAAAKLDPMTENPEYTAHGKQVVDTVMKMGELPDFIRRWRLHFVLRLKPQYLNDDWNVDYGLDDSPSTGDAVQYSASQHS